MKREKFRHQPRDKKWEVVLARDPRFDGAFVFAVRSTGIYCRPSCPSRRPQRRHVVFFSVPEAAERAGFRACRRCRPGESNAGHAPTDKVREICRIIDEHADETPTLADLAARMGGSPYHLQRTFKRIMGITPRQYADACRLVRLKTNLKEKKNVTEAMYDAGYGSSRSLYERGPEKLGMTPATYRRGGEGARIRFTILKCPVGPLGSLGRLLLAATERGLCRVTMGERADELETGLRQEFPAAEVKRDEAGLQEWSAAVLRHLEGHQPNLDLPLDIQASAFQRKVWEALQAIPYGKTRSYAEIARAVGRPKGARAVGNACGTNPVAVVIPCHRVIQQNGSLGGFGWGLKRKEILLAIEKSAGT
ncbi:MAG TPA: bifunctional DNA-binding transcriptional regulator/O6-methylguanine-DNA methyltransferase Ada [Terriglobia bacterium]|nr:bifunctional DNA-binding transcriptional regulator/O6-methylguanine-DNA methyltransferase Ada [Terriglobia bacterium]